MVFGISAKAQKKHPCFYHVSFYKWEWNCCYEKATVGLQDSEGFIVRDTIIIDTAFHSHIVHLHYPFKKSFDSAHFEITSYDGKIKYDVIGFHVIVSLLHDGGIDNYFTGNYLPASVAFSLNHCKPKDFIIISKIKIFNPDLQKEILLPGIDIYVE